MKRLLCYFLGMTLAAAVQAQTVREVGVAKMNVTPDFPIRLEGYYGRNVEATNAIQPIFAKALAIGSDKEGPAVLVTLDNCILPLAVRTEIADYLAQKEHIESSRFALCVSHNHTSPCLAGAAPNLFGADIPAADQAHIERYTREVIHKIEKVAVEALRDRRPCTLGWAQDHAGFAKNRRTAGGPVDQDLPILAATDLRGNLRAILGNYACHCTTLGNTFTEISGDWAAYAQDYLEQDHPGTIVLTAVGCGADANPFPRGTLDLAKTHGREFADSVNHALKRTLLPLRGPLECRTRQLDLPLATPPTREEWEKMAGKPNAMGYYARKNLQRLDRGEILESSIPYLVQEWNFGHDLAMIFLSGEPVVDYSLRLKKEFDSQRLWINGYANSVPAYIPSRRILKEGGYEGGGAMVYYDHPAPFTPAIEDTIINAVHEIMPTNFLFDEKLGAFPPPKSPADSMAEMQTDAGMKIELVASEPLIESPVAIDWGADGKLWVAEMRDYPMGMDNHWKPGGRIVYLEATNGDGVYNKATTFLDDVPFPTGVTAWRKGALICAAPDILEAESTQSNGYANVVKKIFSGFYTENYQARVNSLTWGLDNWVYGANGLLGGAIHGMAGGGEVDIRGRDFRMHPDTGVFEPAAGLTQQGRVRDDWGNWFGCDNSNPFWNYPLADQYVRRNPYVTSPSPRVYAATGKDPNLVYPTSRVLERFNEPNSVNHITSGCGLGINRDVVLGADYAGNAFVCEPVADVVHRLQLREDADGAVVTGTRATNEEDCEFLTSRDNWSRPVQSRLGPDGALYVVDMYRFVIEHPDWISKERLAQLDIRAGAEMGRIYRIYPARAKLRPILNLRALTTPDLVRQMNTPNGIERDLVHTELVQRADPDAIPPLIDLAHGARLPAVRIQAMCALDGLNALPNQLIERALHDPDVHVRRQALRLAETHVSGSFSIEELFNGLTEDPAVRFQLALSLGQWNDVRAGRALGRLALAGMDHPWVRAAVISSAVPQTAEILKAVLTAPPAMPGRGEMINQLMATAAGQDDEFNLAQCLIEVAPREGQPIADWQFPMLKTLIDTLARKKLTLESFAKSAGAETTDAVGHLQPIFVSARALAMDTNASPALRATVVSLLAQDSAHATNDLKLLGHLIGPDNPPPVQQAAVESLKHNPGTNVPSLLLADWAQLSPALREPILEILLSRDEFTRALLDAIHHRVIQTSEITPANRQRMLQNPAAGIKKDADALFPAGTSTRAEVVARYASVSSLVGDAAKGHRNFVKNCIPCHRLKNEGNAVGPNLAALVDKTPGDFVLAIMDPSAVIEPRFVAYNIETRDDRSLTGVVSAETSTSLTLTQAGGAKETILRSDIVSIKANKLSLMPEGFEQAMNPQDLADLIAYLKQR